MVRFVIHKKSEECYYVALIDNYGNIILRGIDCANLPECISLMDSIRNNANDFSKYELKDSHEGKFYLELVGPDGKEIAQSAIFETAVYAYHGIEFVRRNIPYARVVDHRFVA